MAEPLERSVSVTRRNNRTHSEIIWAQGKLLDDDINAFVPEEHRETMRRRVAALLHAMGDFIEDVSTRVKSGEG